MKIGIDIRPLMQKNYSGVSEYTFQLLKHLFEIDDKNQYILFYNAHKNLEKYIPKFDYPNVSYKGFNYPNKLFNLSLLTFQAPKLDRLIGNVDIFFMPSINFAAISSNTKSVIMVHDLSFERYPEFFDTKHKLWHSLIYPKELITNSYHLVTPSKNTRRDTIELYNVPKDKITVTYEGLDPQFINFKPKEKRLTVVKNKYKLPEKFILYLATLEPRKNIISIIDALKDIPSEYKLVLAGRKGWKYKEIIEASNSCKERIQLLGYVPQNDKPELYYLAKVFVWPSFYEGFGLPPLEAQACGTPVVTGANSSLVEVIQNSGLLVNVDRVNEISQAINELIHNEQLRNKYIEKGFQNSKRFRWKKTAEQTMEVFEKIHSA